MKQNWIFNHKFPQIENRNEKFDWFQNIYNPGGTQSTLENSKILTVLRQGLGKKFRLWRQAGCLLRWDILPLTQSYLEKSQVFLLHCFPLHRSRHTYNLFVTSKNKTTNSRIHELKCCIKTREAFKPPFWRCIISYVLL